MLCRLCKFMLSYNHGKKGNVSNLQIQFWHQPNRESLENTAETWGCYICRILNAKVQKLALKPQSQRGQQVLAEEHFLSASLRAFPNRRGLYRLDFEIEGMRGLIASFALQENDSHHSDDSAPVPVSASTEDSKVFDIARKWIKECEDNHPKCQPVSLSEEDYPTRLIHIEATDTNPRVRLVSRKPNERRYGQPPMTGHYVSLSHCWGKKHFTTLNSQTKSDFLDAIPWEKLPLTFQHTIQFAAKFGVQWVWIDALCIIQGKDEESKEDWLTEAARMREVYKNAYFNISATASHNSYEKLYRERDDTVAWFDKDTLNTKELLGGSRLRGLTQPTNTQPLPECTILDLAFWETYVEMAPVNRRSWVFQERILAPRVIHFCEDQIAFECQNSDRAECRPEGLPHYQIQGHELVDGARLKSFDASTGRQIRLARLSSRRNSARRRLEEMANPEDPQFKRMYFYELWKRIVDTYTKMDLTMEQDRLIALSGIAREMASKMTDAGLKDKYLAGMWQESIATQILWHVNEGVGSKRQPYEDSQPKDRDGHHFKRAPSFSWGSVESDRGINFPEPTDAKALIKVNMVRLVYERGEDMYGLLKDGYIVVKGVLRRIELTDTKAPRARPTFTQKFLVRGPKGEDKNVSETRSYQRTRYFLSLGLTVHFTDRSAFTVALIAACLLSICLLAATNTFSSLGRSWLITLSVIALTGLVLLIPTKLLRFSPEPSTDLERTTNRYNWRLINDGEPTGPAYESVYLDSPASQPSIFGPSGRVYCIPALVDDENLTCLLVQATEEGDYGVRYKRVGLAKVLRLFGDEADILNITTAPGHNEIKDGQYYWMPKMDKAGKVSDEPEAETRDGESTICII